LLEKEKALYTPRDSSEIKILYTPIELIREGQRALEKA